MWSVHRLGTDTLQVVRHIFCNNPVSFKLIRGTLMLLLRMGAGFRHFPRRRAPKNDEGSNLAIPERRLYHYLRLSPFDPRFPRQYINSNGTVQNRSDPV